MTETKYAELIKNLFQDYYHRRISVAEYRELRAKIIGDMDREFNGGRAGRSPQQMNSQQDGDITLNYHRK